MSSIGRLFAAAPVFALLLGAANAYSQRPVVLASASSGEGFACAVVADDTVEHRESKVYCWGDARPGAWDPPSNRAIWGAGGHPSTIPLLIQMPDSVGRDGIVSLAAGATPFACVVVSSGAVYCWGNNDYSALGSNSMDAQRTAVRVPLPEAATAVSAGEYSACALTRTGRIFCWGDNEHGKLGAGDTTDHRRPVPVRTTARFVGVSVGASGGTCGVTTTGSALCWGVLDGQLGLRMAEEPQADPIAPIGVPAERYRSVTVGNSFACALQESADVRCWGNDDAGELGSGQSNRELAQRLVTLPNGEQATQVSSGFKSACAVTTSQRVACWGGNDRGELGRGVDITTERAPGFVAGDSRYREVSVGGSMICAITVARTLDCWGSTHGGTIAEERAMRLRSRPTAVVFP